MLIVEEWGKSGERILIAANVEISKGEGDYELRLFCFYNQLIN